ncbi:MAG: 3-dehydrotetronate 4-kinase, partial [Subtercola sp.]|nr:3-dehydrotetronate 4-kinase [Subtercola sp.]
STFDSTPAGNIGPVIDALADDLGVQTTVVVPSFPEAGRTVYQGHLFVHDQLLSESPMREHPLTPMTESDVARLLRPQSVNPVTTIPLAEVRRGAAALRAQLEQPDAGSARRSVVIDALDDTDLAIIAEATRGQRFVSGGSGLAVGMSSPLGAGSAEARAIGSFPGRRAVLAGSASAATRAQIASASAQLPSLKLDIARAAADAEGYADEVRDWAARHWAAAEDRPVLVYATGSPADLKQNTGLPDVADLVERMLGSIAVRFVAAGVSQLIVAGGETSGRTVSMLGVRSLIIGPAIAPGVAWSEARGRAGRLALALKSGNFGGENMFVTAWEALS